MDKLVKTSLMVLFLTCSTILSAQTGRTTLKIVHYNVGVFSKEIENSIPMIAGMMKELDADVISLNELDSCNLRHDTYQLRDFAAHLQSSVFKLSKDLIDSIHEEGIVAYTS